ncbi:MAG: sulfatase [Pseudomonadota bacterium]
MKASKAAALFGAALLLYLILVQPNHPLAMTWAALLLFPLELPAILLGAIVVGQTRAGRVFRIVLTLVLTVLFVQKTADFISFSALSRAFNPVTDLSLIEAFFRLLSGSLGWPLTLLATAAALVATLAVALGTWWALGVWIRWPLRGGLARATTPLALLATALAVAEIGDALGRWSLPYDPPGAAFTARVGVERVQLIRDTRAELRHFRALASADPFAQTPPQFSAIDRDVLVIFVESYGRTSFDTPLYSDLHLATLARYSTELGQAGLSMRSGFLTSPTQGGQSWLSHSTFANGLWITNQVSYAAALSSGRDTLYHYASEAGFRTAAVMPQITLDWPEAELMGFEDVLVAADLGYRGLPMNWVTMPDQFTLAALDRLIRTGDDPRHLFAQVVLVSSHAPWVPVPEILPWDTIGDGTVYNEIATSGDPPEVVWRDRTRVRSQYRLALDYSLQAVLEYARLHADDPPLILIVGDHQAAESIALDARAEVPLHVIGPAALVDRLQSVAQTVGLIPAVDTPIAPMETMRDVLLTAFEGRP